MKREEPLLDEQQYTEPCGCIVTARYGHVNTRPCATHHAKWFNQQPNHVKYADNLDLIGQ